MSYQLPLDLASTPSYARADLMITPAVQRTLDVLLNPVGWLGAHLVLFGPRGSGKTHMGHIFAAQFDARFLRAEDTFNIDTARLGDASYVVDDADTASEDLLFHLSNHVQKTGRHLVLLTRTQPVAWQPKLADLGSRLRAMRLLVVPEADDALLIAILKNLFSQRAISPSADCLDYLARRMERSVGAAQKIVTDLEHYANGRAFNRTLARDFFDESGTLGFGDDY